MKKRPGRALFSLLVLGACSTAPEENEYYQAYLEMESQLAEAGSQVDSVLVRVRELETAIADAEAELAGAQTAAIEAQLAVTRDPPSAEYHAQDAQQRIERARSRLSQVQP